MKTLLTHRIELERRLSELTPADAPLWGRMSASQMLAHVADACRLPLGEKHAAPAALPIPPAVIKWLALRAPIRWAHNMKTIPEADQSLGGTAPTSFEHDRASVLMLLARVAEEKPRAAHPYFGPMTPTDWHIHAYRHTDHHLRQFGR